MGGDAPRVPRVRAIPRLHQHRLDVGIVQLLAYAIELVEIADRADSHAMKNVVVDRHALHARLDAEQRDVGLEPVGVGHCAERAGL